MRFEQLALEGVWRVHGEPIEDDRGFFARAFCGEEFAAHGLPATFEQSSISHNDRRGTLRGMHYQSPPHGEAKFVRCVRGAVFDVALDVRPGSQTFGQWVGEVLTADNMLGLFIAPGFAHGFQTMVDDTDILYLITPTFVPGRGTGVRWNDPAFKIEWPINDPILSLRDSSYPDWVR
jgi:dTDP-4-dehydrorhamnose 3,5-epimerase